MLDKESGWPGAHVIVISEAGPTEHMYAVPLPTYKKTPTPSIQKQLKGQFSHSDSFLSYLADFSFSQ